VVDDEKVVKAKHILKKTLAPLASVKKSWLCTSCGENIEGQFSECWNCGHDRYGAKPRRWLRSVAPSVGKR
jgi:rubrerythrin